MGGASAEPSGGRDSVSQAAGSRGFLKKLSLLSMIYMSGRSGLN